MKTIITAALTAILLLTISCTKENITTTTSKIAQSTDKVLTFTIGQHYGGGIIFYIDSTGQHGLIADTVDLPPSVWWNGIYTTTGATAKRVGKGYSNTRKIILSQGDSGHYAARRCWNHKGSGYKDWFLPSKNELHKLYEQRKVVGGFANDYYWTSSETAINDAWIETFAYYGVAVGGKGLTFHVRAIRAF